VSTATVAPKKIRTGTKVRHALLKDVKKAVDGAQAIVITKWEKVPTRDLNGLRTSLKGIDSNFFVVKNSLSRIVCREQGWAELEKVFEGTCAITPVKGDVAAAAKLLAAFQKGHEGFVLQGGVLEGKFLKKQDIDALAKLPSRQVLLSQLAGVLISPIRNLAVVLQAPIREAALVLAAVKQKKEKEPAKAAPAKAEPAAQEPAKPETPAEESPKA
jgi:large subunit ribosomal protein L10